MFIHKCIGKRHLVVVHWRVNLAWGINSGAIRAFGPPPWKIMAQVSICFIGNSCTTFIPREAIGHCVFTRVVRMVLCEIRWCLKKHCEDPPSPLPPSPTPPPTEISGSAHGCDPTVIVEESRFGRKRYVWPGPEVIKLFKCSTERSMIFIMLLNVKMPTIVDILTFTSIIKLYHKCHQLLAF